MPLFRQFHGRQPAPAPWLLLLLGLLLPGCGQLPWQPQPGGRGSDGSGGPAAPGPAASPPAEQAPPLLSLADHPDLRRSAARIARCARQIGAATPLIKPADASNFGDRLVKDAWGRELPHRPQLIVLHETVSSLESTLAHFQRHHPDDNDQASYHRLVDRDGTVIQLVPDGNRAYGAGQSAFGDFALQSRPGRSPSINNVALHLSLVSPADGSGDGEAHSGYSDAQYRVQAHHPCRRRSESHPYGSPFLQLDPLHRCPHQSRHDLRLAGADPRALIRFPSRLIARRLAGSGRDGKGPVYRLSRSDHYLWWLPSEGTRS